MPRFPPIRVVTLNVWFVDHHFSERNEAIFRLLEDSDADAICLQEVTPPFLNSLRQQPWFSNYTCSDNSPTCNTVDRYGVLMLVKSQFEAEYTFVNLPTTMARRFLLAELNIDLAVGTVHLESLDNSRRRAQQLEIITQCLRDIPTAIVVGDFNFCSYRNFNIKEQPLENDGLKKIMAPSEWSDAWAELKPNDKGYTFDSEVNKNIFQTEQMRYDRVMYKSTNKVMELSAIDLFAHEPISDDGQLFPSDHFGLVADFVPSTR